MSQKYVPFDPKWKKMYEWANSVPGEKYKIYCLKCKKIFRSNRGEICLKEHDVQHSEGKLRTIMFLKQSNEYDKSFSTK